MKAAREVDAPAKDIPSNTETPVSKNNNNGYISIEAAKQNALDNAGVKFSKAELDRDDLIVHYDVDFVAGKYEYEYEINAETGKVIVFDKEFND